jgi:hypothetical protein
MTEQERTRLLETAQRHLDALTAILDRLASLGAEAELRVLAIRLEQLSFRAAPSAA